MKKKLFLSHLLSTLALFAGMAVDANATAGKYAVYIPMVGLKSTAANTSPGGVTPSSWEVIGNADIVFSQTSVGYSAFSEITIRNSGAVPASLDFGAITGVNAADFWAKNECLNIAANATCRVVVEFRPTESGRRSALAQIGATALRLTGLGYVEPNDPYANGVVSLLHMDGSWEDVKGSAVTPYKNVQNSAATAVSGTRSAYTKSDGGLVIAAQPAIGLRDFTIEMWVMVPSNNTMTIIDQRPSQNNGSYPTLQIYQGTLNYHVGGTKISGAPLPLNQWSHIAASRTAGYTKLFINGQQVGKTYSDSNNYQGGDIVLGMDNYWDRSFYGFEGYMDEYRLTIGTGRYNTTFTPETRFPDR